MNTIIIYPGRFQPFGKHHNEVYRKLISKFGKDSIYIATSNKTKYPESPFDFKLKKKIIQKYGIDGSKVVQVKNPYICTEITSTVDVNNTAVIFVYGQKDFNRLAIQKKDGSPGYFEYYSDTLDLQPLKYKGYIYPIENIEMVVDNKEMSGTTLRKYLETATLEQFEEIMGWKDEDIYMKVRAALNNTTNEMIFFLDKMTKIITEGGAAGHMLHPFENKNLSFGEMKLMIKELLSGKLRIVKDISEKVDGQNLMITFKDGKLLSARNKSTIKNPMTLDQVKSKFANRGDIYDAFTKTMENLELGFSKIDTKVLNSIFQNGMNFINLEILYPSTKNVIDYGTQFTIVFHSIEQFSPSGEKLGSVTNSNEFVKKLISDINSKANLDMKFTTGNSPKITRIPNFKIEESKLIKLIDKIQSSNNLNDSNTIGDYYDTFWTNFLEQLPITLTTEESKILLDRWSRNIKSNKLTRSTFKTNLEYIKKIETTIVPKYNKKLNDTLEIIFLKLGTLVLKNLTKVLSLNPDKAIQQISSELDSIINKAKETNDIVDKKKISAQLRKLNSIGGKNAIVPTEGIVFTFNNQQYKLTGTFAPINQILGLYKYDR